MTRATVRATAKAFGVSAFAAVVAAAAALFTVSAGPAEALPSYARQTGQPCATCHTAFPELTPYGRRFQDRRLHGGRRRLARAAGRRDVHAELHPHAVGPGFAARARIAHQRQPRLATGVRASSPASFTAISARSFR